jgi:hypothetical protein
VPRKTASDALFKSSSPSGIVEEARAKRLIAAARMNDQKSILIEVPEYGGYPGERNDWLRLSFEVRALSLSLSACFVPASTCMKAK